MYEITSWEDVRKVAPISAVFFRYRRPTGERRKFYEGGYAFPLEAKSLHARKPLKKRGVFAVYFYSAEEGKKDAHEARPLIIQPPDCDEILVEFPKRHRQGDQLSGVYIRELLHCLKDLARTASGPSDACLKLLEKVSHERDLMAVEVEKNRVGPVWQLLLMHQPELTELIKTGGPLLAAMFAKFTGWVSNERETSKVINELASQQTALNERMNEVTRLLTELQKRNMEVQEVKAASKPIGGQRRKVKKAER